MSAIPATTSFALEDAHGPVPPRQCGRCRQFFAGDPLLSVSIQQAWWLCPPCHATLLGADRKRHGGR